MLRLLALLGEAGMLIPRPRGAGNMVPHGDRPPAPAPAVTTHHASPESNGTRPSRPHLRHRGRVTDSSSKRGAAAHRPLGSDGNKKFPSAVGSSLLLSFSCQLRLQKRLDTKIYT